MLDIALVFSMCIVGFLPMYIEHKIGKFDFFNIKNGFIVYYVIQLGFSGLVSISSKYSSDIGISPVDFREYYTKSFLLSLIGLICFQLGYYLFYKKSIKIPQRLKFPWKNKNVYLVSFIFFSFGVLAFILFLLSNGGVAEFLANRGDFRAGGMSGQGFLIFPATHLFNASAFVYAIKKLNRGSKRHLVISVIILFISILPATLMGFRGLIILPILEFLVIINYRFKAISSKILLPIVSVIIVLFIGYGIIRELPSSVEVNYEVVSDLVDKNPELLYSVISRSKGTEVVAAEIKKLEETGQFDYGYKSIIEVFTIFIPGKLWESKPEPSSVRFSTYFFGDDLAFTRGIKRESWGGISPTIVGEFYWHFGWFGVLIGLFVFGFLFCKIYNTFIRNKDNLTILFVYAEIFPTMIMMAEAVQGYANSLVLYFISWCLLYIVLKLKFDLSL